MAKARDKKTTTGTRRDSNTAEKLAAIRWLAMKIEQVSIELLVTNRGKFEAVEGSLREEVKRLKQMARPEPPLGGDRDVVPGGVLRRPGWKVRVERHSQGRDDGFQDPVSLLP